MPGVYGGFLDKFPMGAVVNRSLTIETGQTHVQRYLRPLLERIVAVELDASFVISHRVALHDAASAYAMWNAKDNAATKIVLEP